MLHNLNPKKHPLTVDEINFILRVSKYTLDREFKYDRKENSDKNFLKRDAIHRDFASNLKHILVYTDTDTATAWHTGQAMRSMHNSDRMFLMKMRPSLINDVDDLKLILNNFTAKDRLLFATSQVEKIFDLDRTTRFANIDVIANLLPKNERLKFHAFAYKIMDIELEKYKSRHLSSSSITTHTASFSAAFLFAALGILSHSGDIDKLHTITAFLFAAGFAANGLHELFQEKQLARLFTPITRELNSIWHKAENLAKNAEAKLPATAPRLI